MRLGVIGRKPRTDDLELRLGIVQGDGGREAAERSIDGRPFTGLHAGAGNGKRRPELLAPGEREVFRHDANDGMFRTAHANLLADDG